jgi:hypothetical protein
MKSEDERIHGDEEGNGTKEIDKEGPSRPSEIAAAVTRIVPVEQVQYNNHPWGTYVEFAPKYIATKGQ